MAQGQSLRARLGAARAAGPGPRQGGSAGLPTSEAQALPAARPARTLRARRVAQLQPQRAIRVIRAPFPAPKRAATGKRELGPESARSSLGPNQGLLPHPYPHPASPCTQQTLQASALGQGGTWDRGEKEAGKARWQVPLGCPELGCIYRLGTNLFKIIQQLNPKLGIKLWCLGTFKCSLRCSLEIFPEIVMVL